MEDSRDMLLRSGAARVPRGYALVKPVVDRIAGAALLVLLAPVLGCVALVLKCTSEGPVFYSQVRLGHRGRPFRIHKFRTMTHCCEDQTGPVWSLAGDPRITRVGRWLRDTHLDELPQLWNVVRGEMSLIGPRPERPEIASRIERSLPEFRERLAVRPGITGLAQVCQPADADLGTVRRKLAYDARYIRGLGPVMDVRVAAATVLHLAGSAAGAVSRRLAGGAAPCVPLPVEDLHTRAAPGFGVPELATVRDEVLSRAA